MGQLQIGYLSNSYPYQRNIVHKLSDVKYRKVIDLYKIVFALSSKFPQLLASQNNIRNLQFKFNDLNLNQVEILHFFNTINIGKTAWVTTFETVIPRITDTLNCHWGENPDFSHLTEIKSFKKSLMSLAKPSCKRLIALSECNSAMQQELLSHFPEYQDLIARKISVLHPPQSTAFKDLEEKQLELNVNSPLKFMFVGRAFFRKGGVEILKTFQKIRKYHSVNIQLTIVSSLEIDNYATHETLNDICKVQEILTENSEWIRYFPNLPNLEVLELMKETHIGLLPTWADTYGYSVLEFQAAGCPVISTDIRALPEINSNECGWLISVPKNRLGEGLYTTPEHRSQMREEIANGLEEIILAILANRDSMIPKAQKCLERITQEHCPVKFAEQLQSIYLQAL